jgi:hypothetical protein
MYVDGSGDPLAVDHEQVCVGHNERRVMAIASRKHPNDSLLSGT